VRLTVPYGDAAVAFEVPRVSLAGVVSADVCRSGAAAVGDGGSRVRPGAASKALTEADEQAEIRRALTEPIGAPRLCDLAKGRRSAVIVVSDVTRPCPSYKFLPALLDELRPIPATAVTILFGLGSHRPHAPEEQRVLVGEEVATSGVTLLDSGGDDFVSVGVTSRGTPLAVSRPYLEADIRVCTGNIDYHYFAGFSGGAKAVVPGLCTSDTIRANHGMMLHDGARAGVLEGNPVREDIDEAGGIVGIDFLFNVVLDEERRVARAVAGDYLVAHRVGAAFYDALYDLRVDEPVDVVVASPGGSPKDMNLYQAQKTLDNVAGVVRDGGVIILVARCEEGLGNPVFEEWMTTMRTPHDLVERIRREFVLGGHKAAAIASLLERVDLFLVSELPDELVWRMHMKPFHDVDAAVRAALASRGAGTRVLVVPHGRRVTVRREAPSEEGIG